MNQVPTNNLKINLLSEPSQQYKIAVSFSLNENKNKKSFLIEGY